MPGWDAAPWGHGGGMEVKYTWFMTFHEAQSSCP